MAMSSLVYDEGGEQIMLGLDVDVVEMIHKILENHVNWSSIYDRTLIDNMNLLGDDFKAFLHLKGAKT